jgi:hypothetical protein
LVGIYKAIGVRLPDIGLVAAPRIVVGRFCDLRPNRVKVNVLEQRQKIGIPVAQDGLVSALEEVAHGPVLLVKIHGVALVDALEDLGEGCLTGFEQEVDVVALRM